MPGSGTHTTVIQHLAQANQTFQLSPGITVTAQDLLGDPSKNASWNTYIEEDAIQSRFAILGAMGPDIFYAMLDYGGDIQTFEDICIKILGTFQCVGQVSGEISKLIDQPMDLGTGGLWTAVNDTFNRVSAVFKEGALDLIIEQNNFWSLFLPLRQVDDFRRNWYWADYLHYVKTGAFTTKLLDMSKDYTTDATTTKYLKAYALGYLTHYVADTVGHAYVNRIVESPWRNCWQRHHLVENFIDAYLWDHWHDISTITQRPLDEPGLDVVIDIATADSPSRRIGDGAPLHYARLNDLANIGDPGIDKMLDAAIAGVCAKIQADLFNLGESSVPPRLPSDDAPFVTWTNFMADAIRQTYGADEQHPIRLSSSGDECRAMEGGFPTADDIAGAYGAYRLILSLATEDSLSAPPFPDIVGDIAQILNDLWTQINQNLGNIPPPPPVPSSGGFTLDGLWDAIKSYAQWLGQVAAAVAQTIGDIIVAAIKAGGDLATEPIKVGLWLLNSALFVIYRTFRMKLVLAAYAVPFSDELTGMQGPLDLTSLWTTMAGADQPYPIEPLLSQRDLGSNPAHPHSPYLPYLKPSDAIPPPNVEMPPVSAPAELLAWATPDDMLEKPAGKDNMFMADGPAPAVTVPLLNTDGTVKTTLESFDGSQRYFGGIFANCESALRAAIPYLSGGTWPEGTVLPDYNLDSDRGYAWPCWEVDYTSRALEWNGCDPYPDDTNARAALPPLAGTISAILAGGPLPLNWGPGTPATPPPPPPPPPRPGLKSVDPWGNHRNGLAWVNAAPLAASLYTEPTLAYITVDPMAADTVDPGFATLDDLDPCVPNPGGTMPDDYRKTPTEFCQNFAGDFAVMDPTPGSLPENDGRLIDFLRAHTYLIDPAPPHNKDALAILANAVTLILNQTVVWPAFAPDTPSAFKPPPPIPSTMLAGKPLDRLVMAVAQLAVTGRDAFTNFNTPQDADLIKKVISLNPNVSFDPGLLAAAAHKVLDMAYLTLWAIRSNDLGWRHFRSVLGAQLDSYFKVQSTYTSWIAVSGFDDTSHRPVNVPTAPYPQFDITFVSLPFDGTSPTHPKMTTRYLVASAHTWVGAQPDDGTSSSFNAPAGAWPVLAPPAGAPFSPSPAPRTLPNDQPVIPSDNDVIVYIHGGGSRAEEAVAMANWLIFEGMQLGRNYTIISCDLPNTAYANRFDLSDLIVGDYQPDHHPVRDFELQYIRDFIDALDLQIGNVKGRIKAVMGGSLGGNMSLLLSREKLVGYTPAIVAWSVTAAAPSLYLHFISSGWVGVTIAHLKDGATDSELVGTEDHSKETQYLHHLYVDPLNPGTPGEIVPYMPPDPLMWFRGPDPVPDIPPTIADWSGCKKDSIKASRFDRYEIYSKCARHWTNAIDLEQIYFSFQEFCKMYEPIANPLAKSSTTALLLAAGERDNYAPNAIYNSTLDLARLIRHTAHGKAEFWLDTGHSIHSERPRLFSKEIVSFLQSPGAVSPFSSVGAPQPAPPSLTTE